MSVDPVCQFVTTTAREILGASRVLLFGSRARGDHRERSDYDFAIEWQGAAGLWGKFATHTQEHAPTLCELDLVNMNDELDSLFRNKIFAESQVLYE